MPRHVRVDGTLVIVLTVVARHAALSLLVVPMSSSLRSDAAEIEGIAPVPGFEATPRGKTPGGRFLAENLTGDSRSDRSPVLDNPEGTNSCVVSADGFPAKRIDNSAKPKRTLPLPL